MIYLIYSLENFLIRDTIQKIKTENQIEDINVSQFDLNTDLIENIVEDAETFSLFADKKMIIVNNALIFTAKKNNIEQNSEVIERYIENYNPQTILVFSVNESKLDERKKIVKLIKKNGIIKEFNSINLDEIITNLFKPYDISKNDIKYMLERTGTNLDLICQEINKIKTYKASDLNITHDDITNLTCQNIEADLFTLIDKIVNKDINSAINIYHEMLKQNEEPIAIIISLANKIRSLYQTKELFLKGYSEYDIASILGVKPGYLYYMRSTLNNYNSGTLLNLLHKLADLDFGIKSGKINKENALELFILEM